MLGRYSLKFQAIRSLLSEPPWPIVLSISIAAWFAMARLGHGSGVTDLCVTASGALLDQSWRALQAALWLADPVNLALSWVLMLIAMMSLVLVPPFRHLWYRSMKRRRVRAIAFFLSSYCAIWMLFATLLVFAGILTQIVADLAKIPSWILAATVLVFWQTTPWKQHCLNLCHWTPRLNAFGWAADRDCLRYGARDACLCIGTCWALMLLPIAVHAHHLPFMAFSSVVMVQERLKPCRAVRWYPPGWKWSRYLADWFKRSTVWQIRKPKASPVQRKIEQA